MERRQEMSPRRTPIAEKIHFDKGVKITDILAIVTSVVIATAAILTFVSESRQTRIELVQIQKDFKEYQLIQKEQDARQDARFANDLAIIRNDVKTEINRLEGVILQLFARTNPKGK